MTLRPALIAACLFACIAGTAHAQTFAFDFTAGDTNFGLTDIGTLSVQATGTAGIYQITALTGTETFYFGGTPSAMAITSLLSPPNDYGADDLLYLGGGPLLDDSGLAFSFDNGGSTYIAYNEFQGAYVDGEEFSGNFTISPLSVPEPASLALLAGGVLTLAGVARSRRAAIANCRTV